MGAREARFPFIRVYDEVAAVQRMFDEYRERAARRGWKRDRSTWAGWCRSTSAETDDQAQQEAERHILYLFREADEAADSDADAARLQQSPSHGPLRGEPAQTSRRRQAHLREMQDKGFIVFGSAETVRQRLLDYQQRLGFGKLVTLLQFGSLPADLTRQNMERFAREIMPALRPVGISPSPAAVTG